MKEKTIYDLELFEVFDIIKDKNLRQSMMRVPGGWLNKTSIKSNYWIETFIPYSTEFKSNEPLEMD